MNSEYELSAERLQQLFSWEEEISRSRTYGAYPAVVELRNLFTREAILKRLERGIDQASSVPVDLFVHAFGEPRDRSITKIGGVPYRPRNAPWPLDDSGRPMAYLAQFRFFESRDIVGETCGDVLLVFVTEPYNHVATNSPQSWFKFEWQPRGLTDLVDENEAHGPLWRFVTCYGMRYRTLDFRVVPVDAAWQFIERENLAVWEDIAEDWATALVHSRAMKIGGIPFYGPSGEISAAPPGLSNSKFICSICNINVSFDLPYPWANHPEPISLKEANEQRMQFYDGTHIHLYLRPNGEVVWQMYVG